MNELLKGILALCIFLPIVGPVVYCSEYAEEIGKYFEPTRLINGIHALWSLNTALYNDARRWGNLLFGIVLWPFQIMSFLWAMAFFLPWRACKFLFILLFKSRKG